jgi:hypothetical protein
MVFAGQFGPYWCGKKGSKAVFIWHVIKGIVRPLEFVGMTRLIRPAIINRRPGKFFLNVNDTISREEHKTIYSGIIGMAFSNESELPAQSPASQF